MGAVPVHVLRVIIWISLCGSLVIQLGFTPLVGWEMHDSGAPLAAVNAPKQIFMKLTSYVFILLVSWGGSCV